MLFNEGIAKHNKWPHHLQHNQFAIVIIGAVLHPASTCEAVAVTTLSLCNDHRVAVG